MAYQSWAKWSLFSLDTYEEFEGQFPLETATQEAGAHYEDAWTLNRQEPISQWIHGIAEQWSFTAKLRQLDSSDDLRSRIAWLLGTVTKDDTLGRPPLYVWTWGSIDVTCYITHLGGIEYKMASPNQDGQGLPKEATFQVTLRKYKPYDIKVTDPNEPFRDTLYVNAKIGQTYEALAAAQYGDPDWGDLLRRRSPGVPFLLAGTVVALPKAERFYDADLEPESAPLLRTDEGLEARQAIYALRGASKVSYVI